MATVPEDVLKNDKQAIIEAAAKERLGSVAPVDEDEFQRWYAEKAAQTGINPDPDNPDHKYDYRAAFAAGAEPNAEGHWPSQFKADDHPNRFVEGVDTKTGNPITTDLTGWSVPQTNSEGIKVTEPDLSTIPVKSVREADGTIKAFNEDGDVVVEYLPNGEVKEHKKVLFGLMDSSTSTMLPGFPADRKYRTMRVRGEVIKVPIWTPEEEKAYEEQMKPAAERFLGDRMTIETVDDMRKAEEMARLYADRHEDVNYYDLLPSGPGEWALPNDYENDKTLFHRRHYMRMAEAVVRKAGEGVIDALSAEPEWTFDELMAMDAEKGYIPGISNRELAMKAMETYSNFKVEHPNLYQIFNFHREYAKEVAKNVNHVAGGLLAGAAMGAFYDTDYSTGSITDNEGNWAEKLEAGTINALSKGAFVYGALKSGSAIAKGVAGSLGAAGQRINVFQKAMGMFKKAPVAADAAMDQLVAADAAAASRSAAGKILFSGGKGLKAAGRYAGRMAKSGAEGSAWMTAENVLNDGGDNIAGSAALGFGFGMGFPVAISGSFGVAKAMGWGLKKSLGPMLTRLGYITPYNQVKFAYSTFDASATRALESVEAFASGADVAVEHLGNIAAAMNAQQKVTFLKMVVGGSNFVELGAVYDANVRPKTPKIRGGGGSSGGQMEMFGDDAVAAVPESGVAAAPAAAAPADFIPEASELAVRSAVAESAVSTLNPSQLRQAKLDQAAVALGIPGRGSWLGEHLRRAGDNIADDIDYDIVDKFSKETLPVLNADYGKMRFEQRLDMAQLSRLKSGKPLSTDEMAAFKLGDESEIPVRIDKLETDIARRQRVHFGGGKDIEGMPTDTEMGELSAKDQKTLTRNLKINQAIEDQRKEYIKVIRQDWSNKAAQTKKLEGIKNRIQKMEEKLYGRKSFVAPAEDPAMTLVVVPEEQIPGLIKDGNLVIPRGYTHTHDFAIAQGAMDEMLAANKASKPVILSLPYNAVSTVPGKVRMGRTVLEADATVPRGRYKVYRPKMAHEQLIEEMADERIAEVVAAGGKAPNRKKMIAEVAFGVNREMGTIEDLSRRWYDVAEKETVRGDRMRAIVEADQVGKELKVYQEALAKALMTPNKDRAAWIKAAGDAAEKYVDESMRYLDIDREMDNAVPDGLSWVIDVIGNTKPGNQIMGVPKAVRQGVLARMMEAAGKWNTPARRAALAEKSFKGRQRQVEGTVVEEEHFGDDMADWAKEQDDMEEAARLGGRSPEAQVRMRQDGSVVADYRNGPTGAGEHSVRSQFAGLETPEGPTNQRGNPQQVKVRRSVEKKKKGRGSHAETDRTHRRDIGAR